ncbi:cyclophilin-like fold protein [Rhodococcus sp. IEGM 1409]|uniref:cyclophilin-like fold protein n=1 Tax=Rhodococcus sp. IEGM 1409 TaxID=3047082 RepID=UPI0024B7D2AC|nr:cyclophilin-like fold protein [Rhodococcus sp. IEGM 1409]MDI9902653.1 cyclophilin-like fold protein [Rhodococcus sp. IEGM 1409]
MRLNKLAAVVAGSLTITITGCSTPTSDETVPASKSAVGEVLRFTTGEVSIEVTIDEDNPATRDLVDLVPFTVRLEDFNGREKIADLPRELNYTGSPGSAPVDGDLIYYIPWGNIGFYYNTGGIGYSDQTLHLGTYDATIEQLERLEGQAVTVEVVN